MANKRLFAKGTRITTVVEKNVYERLSKIAEAKGLTISRYISKVLTQLASR